MTILQHGVEILAQHNAGDIDELPSVRLVFDQTCLGPGRSDDTNGLKKAVADWVSNSEGRVHRNSKTGRGFNNVVTARLLAPPRYDVNDPMTLRKLRDELIRPSVTEYPPFLYKDFTIDPENLIDGLFESDILLKACRFTHKSSLLQAARHILIGPSSADSLETSNRSTRLGNAALNNMRGVTLPFMAYVCTQVRFALSSDEVFGNNSDRGFDIYAFYQNILEALREEELADDVEVLQSRWNDIIFGGAKAEELEEASGTLSQILAQRSG
ncbi:hypothetical protein M407DRAFT_8604 [Tulasnella calospora MUT 4182]|uniref:Uncharacterized protein n=1 Tax=Tulasnella calospora MUT 4182 TaxID=1051891 RepID=A0A0C3Q6M4_9AGAM|nr:hypothetical protein M407DRAFT_8604 [Tulasnella calospora MUT 4182]